jgi:hypothetical protein
MDCFVLKFDRRCGSPLDLLDAAQCNVALLLVEAFCTF